MHRAQTEAQSSDIDIASLVRAVFAAWKRLLLATLVVGIGTFIVLGMMSPRYASEAQIEIVNEEPSLPKQPGVVVNPTAPDADSVRTQARVLQSRDLAAKVAGDLKLANNPDYNTAVADQGFLSGLLGLVGFGPSKNETEEQRVLGTYYKGLQVTPFKDSRVIGIEVRSTDPELAAKFSAARADLPQPAPGTLKAELNSQQLVLILNADWGEVIAHTDAAIYLFDEWDANLDAKNRAAANALIEQLASRARVVEISHRDAA